MIFFVQQRADKREEGREVEHRRESREFFKAHI